MEEWFLKRKILEYIGCFDNNWAIDSCLSVLLSTECDVIKFKFVEKCSFTIPLEFVPLTACRAHLVILWVNLISRQLFGKITSVILIVRLNNIFFLIIFDLNWHVKFSGWSEINFPDEMWIIGSKINISIDCYEKLNRKWETFTKMNQMEKPASYHRLAVWKTEIQINTIIHCEAVSNMYFMPIDIGIWFSYFDESLSTLLHRGPKTIPNILGKEKQSKINIQFGNA